MEVLTQFTGLYINKKVHYWLFIELVSIYYSSLSNKHLIGIYSMHISVLCSAVLLDKVHSWAIYMPVSKTSNCIILNVMDRPGCFKVCMSLLLIKRTNNRNRILMKQHILWYILLNNRQADCCIVFAMEKKPTRMCTVIFQI